jgi:hypothetical protein
MIATTHGELEIKEDRSAARAQTSASTSLFQTSDPSVRFLSFHVLLHNLCDTRHFHFLVIQGGNREARNHYIRNLLLVQPLLHMPRWPRCGDGKSKSSIVTIVTSCYFPTQELSTIPHYQHPRGTFPIPISLTTHPSDMPLLHAGPSHVHVPISLKHTAPV